jgi:hypothetical protein
LVNTDFLIWSCKGASEHFIQLITEWREKKSHLFFQPVYRSVNKYVTYLFRLNYLTITIFLVMIFSSVINW